MERHRPGRPAQRKPEQEQPQRIMPGQGNKLAVAFDLPGFRLYWAKDEPGRLQEMQQYGYTFVEDNELAAGALDSSEAVQQGSKVTRPAGGGFTYFLMKIPAKWHKENEKFKQKQDDEIMESLKPKGPNQYAPRYNGREINGVEEDRE